MTAIRFRRSERRAELGAVPDRFSPSPVKGARRAPRGRSVSRSRRSDGTSTLSRRRSALRSSPVLERAPPDPVAAAARPARRGEGECCGRSSPVGFGRSARGARRRPGDGQRDDRRRGLAAGAGVIPRRAPLRIDVELVLSNRTADLLRRARPTSRSGWSSRPKRPSSPASSAPSRIGLHAHPRYLQSHGTPRLVDALRGASVDRFRHRPVGSRAARVALPDPARSARLPLR